MAFVLCAFRSDNRKRLADAYLQKHAVMAIKEMQLHHIPASITLAQALLESNMGQSQISINANNHFGIKCIKTKDDSACYAAYDDEIDSLGQKIYSYFRVYNTVEASFEDHSKLLKSNPRYYGLFELGFDYKAWAMGLQEAHYASDPAYAQKLIKLIENYQLNLYDTYSNKSDYVIKRISELVIPSDELTKKEGIKGSVTNYINNNKEKSEKTNADSPPAAYVLPSNYSAGDGLKK